MSLLRQTAKSVFAAADVLMPRPQGPRLLIYHQVGTGTGKQMEVTTEDFLWQLDWLMGNREVVDLDTAIDRWDEPNSDELAVLTFDDGYEDLYTTAFPFLRERRLPFTLYLSTEMIESDREGALSWPQVESMLESNLLTVGSHTHTHRDLRNAEIDEIRGEVSRADKIIQRRLGVITRHFAYPWGYWSAVAHEVIVERYRTAALGAPIGRTTTDVHRIHRYPIQLSDGKLWFGSRLRGGLMVEEIIRRRLRGYRGP